MSSSFECTRVPSAYECACAICLYVVLFCVHIHTECMCTCVYQSLYLHRKPEGSSLLLSFFACVYSCTHECASNTRSIILNYTHFDSFCSQHTNVRTPYVYVHHMYIQYKHICIKSPILLILNLSHICINFTIFTSSA